MAEKTTRGDALLSTVFELVADYSGLEPDELDGGSTFIDHGFDSLLLTQLATAIQKKFSTKIVFRQLLGEFNTPDSLVAHLDSVLPAEQFQPENSVAAPLIEGTPAQTPDSSPVAAPDFTPVFGTDLPTSTGPMQELFAQQLLLMRQQLSFMHGGQIEAAPVSAPRKSVEESRSAEVEALKPQQSAPAAKLSEAAISTAKPESAIDPDTEKPKLPPGFGPQVDEESLSRRVPSHIADYLDRLTTAYVKKTKGSKDLTQKYRSVHADPRTAAGFNPAWKELVYPIVTDRSSGAYLWDIDGNKYVDLLNGFGPNFFGHAPDFVTDALREQLDKGFEIGPQTPLAGEVAELVCEMTGLDRATFVNTGSEAVQAAMRVARTVTGRDEIVVFNYDYHGNFDEVLVKGLGKAGRRKTRPLAPGIPMDSVEHIVVLDYGTDEALEEIAARADSLAAVMVEPVQSRHPDHRPREFIRKLRDLTLEKDIVLVFDEVITGFRTGPGGAQEYYGIQADIATYGKVAGGGMPIGIVAGKARFMDTFDGGTWQYGDDSYPEAGVTFFAGTFVRHPLTIAAAHAALSWLKQQDGSIYCQVYRLTSLLSERLNRLFERFDVGIHVANFSSQMYFRISDQNEYLNLLFYYARLNGVYMLEGFPSYLTIAHTEEDIDFVVDVFESGLMEMAAAGVISDSGLAADREFPLTAAQQELWAADQLGDAASCALNESDTVRLRGQLDLPSLEEAIRQAVSRHQALRIVFSNDGSSQKVSDSAVPRLEFQDLSKLADRGKDEALDEFFRSQSTTRFDLESGPLMRVHLLKLSEDLHLFVVYAHHLVFDGWSAEILLKEIGQIYAALTDRVDLKLPRPVTYEEYVNFVNNAEYVKQREEDAQYWVEQGAGRIEPHTLPLDFPRPKKRSYLGDTISKAYGPSIIESLRSAASRFGATQQNVAMGAVALLFARLSGADRHVIGIPTADQAHFEGSPLMGYGVNLLPVCIDIDEKASLGDFLVQVRDRVLDGFEHSRLGYAELSRMPGLVAEDSAGIQVVFNYSGYFDELEFGSVQATALENRRSAVLFDLFLNIVESNNDLYVDADYSTELFKGDSINAWVDELGGLIRQISSSGADEKLATLLLRRGACVA